MTKRGQVVLNLPRPGDLERPEIDNLKRRMRQIEGQEAVGATINASPEQTVLEDANRFALIDTGELKWSLWSTIKSALTTVFNLLYVRQDGTKPLTAEWDIGEDMAIRAERLEARDIEGLSIQDDGGNVGVFVEDGGDVGIQTAAPSSALHVLENTSGGGVRLQRSVDTVGVGYIFRDAADADPLLAALGLAGAAGQWATGAIQNDVILRVKDARILFATQSAGTYPIVVVIDSAGKMGIGPGATSPGSDLHVQAAAATSTAVEISSQRYATLYLKADTDNNGASDDPSIRLQLDGSHIGEIGIDDTDKLLKISRDTTAGFGTLKGFAIDANGKVGINCTPQGAFHVLDGLMQVKISVPDGTAITVLANGTGDVTAGLWGIYIVKPSSGSATMNSFLVAPGDSSFNIYEVLPTDTLALTCNADGSVTLQRTAGTLTYTVTLLLAWL